MPRTNRKPKQAYFDLTTLVDGVTDSRFIRIATDTQIPGLKAGDLVLLDCGRKRPRNGDFICWGTYDSPCVGIYDNEYEYPGGIIGIGVALIRRGRFSLKQTEKPPQPDRRIESLQSRLNILERLPENEAERFKLESEIYKLENSLPEDKWPEVIGGSDAI